MTPKFYANYITIDRQDLIDMQQRMSDVGIKISQAVDLVAVLKTVLSHGELSAAERIADLLDDLVTVAYETDDILTTGEYAYSLLHQRHSPDAERPG